MSTEFVEMSEEHSRSIHETPLDSSDYSSTTRRDCSYLDDLWFKVKHGFFNFVFVGGFDFVDLEDEHENLASLSLPI